MSTIAKAEANFEKAPVGMQQAVCVFVSDIGTQVGEYQGRPNVRHQVIVTWELTEKMTQGENEGKPFMMSKYYTLSLSEKATLRKDLENWRGKSFSEEELQGFDLDRLIGANCFLNITATEQDKRKISAITPLAKGMAQIQPTATTPSPKFSEWIDRERAKSLEMKGAGQSSHEVDADGGDKVDDFPF